MMSVLFFLLIAFLQQISVCRASLHQIAFSGGGSFGAVEIGILKHLVETGLKPADLYTGISAGALNAGFLSYYSNIQTGISIASNIYGSIRNRDIYELLPTTESPF